MTTGARFVHNRYHASVGWGAWTPPTCGPFESVAPLGRMGGRVIQHGTSPTVLSPFAA